MSYNSLVLAAIGAAMILFTTLRLRSVVNDGLHEFHGGRICKVSRIEQPRSFWARLILMVSTGAAGLVVLSEATALLHL